VVEKIFGWLGSHSEKRPWWVILVILLVTALAVVGIGRIKSEFGYNVMLPKKSESVRAMNEADRIFGGTLEEQVLITSDDVLAGKILRKVAGYPGFLKSSKDIWGSFATEVSTPLDDMVYFPGGVLSPVTSGQPSAGTGQPQEPLPAKIGSLNDEELARQVGLNLQMSEMRAKMTGITAGQQNISGDKKALLIGVKLNPEQKSSAQTKAVTDFENVTNDYFKSLEGTKAYISGSASLNKDSNQRTMRESSVLFLIAFIFIIIVLFLTFRRLSDVLATLAVILVTVIWVIGLGGWLGFPFTYTSTAIFPLMLGIDIAYAIHVLSRYYEERRKGNDPFQSVLTSVITVGVAVFLTAATTAFGFASFGISNMPPIQQFGALCVAGVMFSFVLAITLLPAILVLRDRGDKAQARWEKRRNGRGNDKKSSVLDQFLAKIAVISEHHRLFVGVVTLLVLGGCLFLGTQLKTEADLEKMMPKDIPSIVAMNEINKNFGGQDIAYTLVRGDVLEPANLKVMLQYEDDLASTNYRNENGNPLFERGKTFSIADLVKKVNGSIPVTKGGVISSLMKLQTGSNGESSNRLVNKDATVAMVTIRLERGSQQDMKKAAVTMRSISGEITDTGEGLTVMNGGMPALMSDILGSIVPTQLKTSGLALILCALIVILVFGSLFFGLAATSVVFIGIALEIGALALLGWPLDFMTVMVSSLVIGAGIDFGIHVSHRFREEWHYGGVEIDEAMRRTIGNVGKALVAAAVTTAGAFAIIAMSRMSYLRRFGGITALSLTFALLAALLVLPSILAWRAQMIEKKRARNSSSD
jgi:predicted RND superfamily exporter protein